jgi:hypothetical protein
LPETFITTCPHCDWTGHCWVNTEGPKRMHLRCWSCLRGFYLQRPEVMASIMVGARRGHHAQKRHDLWDQAEALRAEYLAGSTCQGMADRYGCAKSTMARILEPVLRPRGWALREQALHRRRVESIYQGSGRRQQLYQLVTETGLTVPEAGAQLGISSTAASRMMHRYVAATGLPWPRKPIALRHGAMRYKRDGCRCETCVAGHIRRYLRAPRSTQEHLTAPQST